MSAKPRSAWSAKAKSQLAASIVCVLAAANSPAVSADLGVDLDTLLNGLAEHASAAGEPLIVKKVGCRENKKPGDAARKIVTCSHVLGPGRMLITNADPSGPLLDINTQRWAAGENGPAVNMMTWLAAVLTGQPPETYSPSAHGAVKKASTEKTASTDIGGYSFIMMDFGNNIAISVSRP